MAAQDVADLIPRVLRAIYGPLLPASGAVGSPEAEAMLADAIADIILFTEGRWNHTLLVSGRVGGGATGAANAWQVQPTLAPEEETVVVAQAALMYFFHEFKDKKVSETLTQDGRTWTYTLSAQVLREQVLSLRDQRDRALKALMDEHPVLARFVSMLEVRDRLASAVLEPWVAGGVGGGQVLVGPMSRIDFIP